MGIGRKQTISFNTARDYNAFIRRILIQPVKEFFIFFAETIIFILLKGESYMCIKSIREEKDN